MDSEISCQSPQTPDPLQSPRARAEAQSLSYAQLRRLHAHGASGMRPGAWEILDEELARRHDRVETAISSSLVEKRYPAIRTIVFVFRGLAAFAIIACVLGAAVMIRAGLPARESIPVALGIVFVGVWFAISYWAAGELLSLLIDIEANTRVLRHPIQTMTQ